MNPLQKEENEMPTFSEDDYGDEDGEIPSDPKAKQAFIEAVEKEVAEKIPDQWKEIVTKYSVTYRNLFCFGYYTGKHGQYPNNPIPTCKAYDEGYALGSGKTILKAVPKEPSIPRTEHATNWDRELKILWENHKKMS